MTDRAELPDAPAGAHARGSLLSYSTSLVFFLVMWCFWGVRYGDFLYVSQLNSIFLPGVEFFMRWMETPEGLVCWIAAFFLQFGYYPILGGLILALFLSASQVLTARAFGLSGSARLLSFVPPCVVSIAATWNAYYVFVPYNMPSTFAPVFATPFVLLAFAGYKRIRKTWTRVAVAVFAAALCYPIAGGWSVFFGFLAALYEFTAPRSEETAEPRRALAGALTLAAALLAPALWFYFTYFRRLDSANIYLTGLMEDARHDRDPLCRYIGYYSILVALGWILLTGVVARALPIIKSGSGKSGNRSQTRRERRALKARGTDAKTATGDAANSESASSASYSGARVVWGLLVILSGALLLLSYHTKSFFQTMSASRALLDCDFERILAIDAENPFPISIMTHMRNIALHHTGRLAADAFSRPVAGISTLDVTQDDYVRAASGSLSAKLKMKVFEERCRTENVADRAMCEFILTYWGQTNVGARIGMNDFVATDDRSCSFMMALATDALVNGEDRLARRYLNELARTLFYRKWALDRLAFLDSPAFSENISDFHNDSEIGAVVDSARETRMKNAVSREDVAASKETAEVAAFILKLREMRPQTNTMTTNAFPNLVFLVGIVDPKEYDSASRERRELILTSLLLQKKKDEFMPLAEKYFEEYGLKDAPKGIEQGYATSRLLTFEQNWRDCKYQFSPETINELETLAKYLSYQANIDDPAVQNVIRTECRGTYWGYAFDNSTFIGR